MGDSPNKKYNFRNRKKIEYGKLHKKNITPPSDSEDISSSESEMDEKFNHDEFTKLLNSIFPSKYMERKVNKLNKTGKVEKNKGKEKQRNNINRKKFQTGKKVQTMKTIQSEVETQTDNVNNIVPKKSTNNDYKEIIKKNNFSQKRNKVIEKNEDDELDDEIEKMEKEDYKNDPGFKEFAKQMGIKKGNMKFIIHIPSKMQF